MAKKRPDRRFVATGAWGTVEYGFSGNHKTLAEAFLEALPGTLGKGKGGKKGIGEKAYAKFMVLFQTLANRGSIPNPSRFSVEDDHIYGVKFNIANRLIRFACFQDGNSWVLTHGFFKPGAQRGKGKWPKSEIEKAELIRVEHLSIFEK